MYACVHEYIHVMQPFGVSVLLRDGHHCSQYLMVPGLLLSRKWRALLGWLLARTASWHWSTGISWSVPVCLWLMFFGRATGLSNFVGYCAQRVGSNDWTVHLVGYFKHVGWSDWTVHLVGYLEQRVDGHDSSDALSTLLGISNNVSRCIPPTCWVCLFGCSCKEPNHLMRRWKHVEESNWWCFRSRAFHDLGLRAFRRGWDSKKISVSQPWMLLFSCASSLYDPHFTFDA